MVEMSLVTFGGKSVAAFLFHLLPLLQTHSSLIKRKDYKARGDGGVEVFCIKDTWTKVGLQPDSVENPNQYLEKKDRRDLWVSSKVVVSVASWGERESCLFHVGLYMLRSQRALRVVGTRVAAATNRHDLQPNGGGATPFEVP